ncbi:MAG: branched-chain amino acid aminotransferase [Kosmotogales bacterium]|nr:branched-chain amino acid aminotransferase [Kosmotogales bacterium]
MKSFFKSEWHDESEKVLTLREKDLLLGNNVYEVIRTYNRIPFAVKKHFERLKKSSSIMQIPLAFTCKELFSIIREGLQLNNSEENREFRIRIILFSGGTTDDILINFEPLPPISKDIYELGVNIGISPIIKPSGWIVSPYLKISGQSWNMRSKKIMNERYDLILLNERGNVCEGTYTNIFLIKENKIVTPDILSGVLSGITRENMISLIKSLEFELQIRPVRSYELFESSEIFLTHTSAGIVPVRKMGEKVLIEDFTDNVTRLLLDNFEGFIMSDETNWAGV